MRAPSPLPLGEGQGEGVSRARLSRRRLLASLPALSLLAAGCGARDLVPLALSTATPAADRKVRVATHNRPAGLWAGNTITAAAGRIPLERHLTFAVLPLNPTRPDVAPAVANAFANWPSVYVEQLGTLGGDSIPDLVVVDSRWLIAAAKADVLVDLNPLLRAEKWFEPAAYGDCLAAGRARGRQLALPLAVWTDALVYDAGAFKAEGVRPPRPDWGWTELLAAAQSLTKPSRWGLALDRDPPSTALLTLGRQRGASIAGGALTEPALLDALRFLGDLVHRQKVAPALEANPPSVLEVMAQRQAAMVGIVLGSQNYWHEPRFQGFEAATWPPGDRPGQGGVHAYAPLMLGVPRSTPRRDLSMEALAALAATVPDAALIPAGTRTPGGAPGVLDQVTPADAAAYDRARADARFLPGDFPYFAVSAMLDELVLPVLAGRKTPEQSAADVAPRIAAKLVDYA